MIKCITYTENSTVLLVDESIRLQKIIHLVLFSSTNNKHYIQNTQEFLNQDIAILWIYTKLSEATNILQGR